MGKDRVAASTLQGIAAVLGVHPGSFYGDDMPVPVGGVPDVKSALRIAEAHPAHPMTRCGQAPDGPGRHTAGTEDDEVTRAVQVEQPAIATSSADHAPPSRLRAIGAAREAGPGAGRRRQLWCVSITYLVIKGAAQPFGERPKSREETSKQDVRPKAQQEDRRWSRLVPAWCGSVAPARALDGTTLRPDAREQPFLSLACAPALGWDAFQERQRAEPKSMFFGG